MLRLEGKLHRRGQSLVEVLIAVAIGAILIIGGLALLAPVLRSGTQATRNQLGTALGRELMDNVRAVSEKDWHLIYNLSKTSSTRYFLVPGTSTQTVATGTESVAGDNIRSGLVGYWKFDEAVGATAYDFSGNGLSGTWVGEYSRATTTCALGSCISFDGATAAMSTASNSILNTDTHSIAFWIYFSGTPDSQFQIFAYRPAGTDRSPGIWTPAGSYCIYWRYDPGNTGADCAGPAGEATAFTPNRWYHVIGTKNGAVLTLYIDGLQTQTTAVPAVKTAGNAPIELGRTDSEAARVSIDDVRVYNRVLSADEVKAIHNATVFTRSFYVDNVNRDGSADITTGGGTDDPSTQKVTVSYNWPQGTARSISTYLTRHLTKTLWQSDWAGGYGADGPYTVPGDQFSTSSNISYSTTTGSLRINGI